MPNAINSPDRAKYDQGVRRLAGGFGVGAVAVFVAALPLYFVGMTDATPDDAARFAAYVTTVNTSVLIRTSLADPLIMIGLLVFLAGFRHLVRQARQEYEWLATLVFGVGLVAITLWLVGDGLQAGSALDTVARADPTIVRGLMEASFPMYGAIGMLMSALLLAAAGHATLSTGVLPRWSGWFAYGAAMANVVAAPSILGGTDYTAFWSAAGYVTFVAQIAMVLWFLIASIAMLRTHTPPNAIRRGWAAQP